MNSTLRSIIFTLFGCLSLQAMLPGVAMGDARVYRCEAHGEVTYSDKPCPDSAVQSEPAVDGLNAYEATSTPSKASVPASRSFKSTASRSHRANELIGGSAAADLQRAKQRCQRIADRLETVRIKLGKGHTAEQGTKLQEQRRQLEAQKRTEKCR